MGGIHLLVNNKWRYKIVKNLQSGVCNRRVVVLAIKSVLIAQFDQNRTARTVLFQRFFREPLAPLNRGIRSSLLKVSHYGMSFEITKLMLIPVNNLCYLIKLLSLFPACAIYSPFVALSIFVVLSNFCRIIKLLPSWGFELFSS